MKRLPRKIKKIAKNCLYYCTTDSYNHQGIYHRRLINLPAHGIVFIAIVYHRTHFKHIVLFGKKIRMAEFKGMLDI